MIMLGRSIEVKCSHFPVMFSCSKRRCALSCKMHSKKKQTANTFQLYKYRNILFTFTLHYQIDRTINDFFQHTS